MRTAVLGLTAAFVAILAVPAHAADGTLSASSTTYTWEGGPMNGVGPGAAVPMGNVRCTAIYQCDNEHLEIKDTGTLVIEIKAGSGANDLDIRLFKSDADGTAPGSPAVDEAATSPVAEDIREDADAKITVRNIKPGFYVAQVAAYNAQAGSYTGTATLTLPPPPAPAAAVPTPAVTAPTPAAPKPSRSASAEAKRKKALASCNKKARKVKNKKKRKAAQKRCKKRYAKKRSRSRS